MRFMPSQPVGFNRMRAYGVPSHSTIATDQRGMRGRIPRSSTLPYIHPLGAVNTTIGTPIINSSPTSLVDGQPSTTGIPISIPGFPTIPNVNVNVGPSAPPPSDNKILGMDPAVAVAVGLGAAALLYFMMKK